MATSDETRSRESPNREVRVCCRCRATSTGTLRPQAGMAVMKTARPGMEQSRLSASSLPSVECEDILRRRSVCHLSSSSVQELPERMLPQKQGPSSRRDFVSFLRQNIERDPRFFICTARLSLLVLRAHLNLTQTVLALCGCREPLHQQEFAESTGSSCE